MIVMMKGMNKPSTISPKEWMSTHHFIKGMNEHPPFYQRNEWTSSILSKEWMNIQHFIKGMDEHPAFYQRNGWTSSILSKLWAAWQRPKVCTQFHCTQLQKTHPDRQTEIYIMPVPKSMGPPNLRPWFGTYCST
jgi:hypothetical protein